MPLTSAPWPMSGRECTCPEALQLRTSPTVATLEADLCAKNFR